MTFKTNVEDGILKKNSISTTHFQIEFSDFILGQQDGNQNGIADIVEVLADAAEYSWSVIIDDLNYDAPQTEYPRILLVLDDTDEFLYYGAVGVTSLLSSGDPFIAISPWLSLDYLRITMAHELFHTVQFSYDSGFVGAYQGVNWAESTATWIEDVVYDEVNDYFNYFDDYFDYVDYSIFASTIPNGSLFQYALNIWPKFLSEFYDDNDIVREIWENYVGSNEPYSNDLKIYHAVEKTIESRGDELGPVFQEFTLWNLDTSQYHEGSNYPTVQLLQGEAQNAYYQINEDFAPALFGSNYLYFENANNASSFNFHLVKPEGVSFGITLVPIDNGQVEVGNTVELILDKNEVMSSEITLRGLSFKDAAIVIVSPLETHFQNNGSTFDQGYLYYYAADFGSSLAPLIQSSGQGLKPTQDIKEGEGTDIGDGKGSNSLNLNVLEYDEDRVSLTWNRPVDSALSAYELHYGTQSGFYNRVIEVDKVFTTFTEVKGLSEGTPYYFKLKAVNAVGTVLFESSEITITPMRWIFSDLSYLNPYYDSVSSLVDLGILSGYPDGSFRSTQSINRAELLKILIEGQDLMPDPNTYRNCFPDVKTDWYAPYVCYARSMGWVSGYPDGSFKPGNTVNKVEALKILFNVYQEPLVEGTPVAELPYPDLDTSAWYSIYVWKASKLGILQVPVGEIYNGSQGRIRGDMADVLYSYLVVRGLDQ